MKTEYKIELQIIDTAFKKLETFIKKSALNIDETNAFSEMLKAGFRSSITAKKNKKAITVLIFVWEEVDDILLNLLQRFGRFSSSQDVFVMNIIHQNLYGKLLENISYEESESGQK